MDQDFSLARKRMVEEQIVHRGVRQPTLLAALNLVRRHLFVPSSLINHAYEDSPLPIEEGQTISQPYIVARMIEAAELNESMTLLEIGTGSGYAAAVASRIVKQVYTIERIPSLAAHAQQVLTSQGYSNIEVKQGDGSLGWTEKGPFNAIVTAGAPVVPTSLVSQLKKKGKMIIPVGDALSQKLLRITKKADGSIFQEVLESVRFVPLIGKEGW
jgi:protein-L-isoaspartate(D-aspartate) O-methyltransferase